ncbi:transaldolase [Marchantia polymorpha subsp. ruderalis]|uniref:Transaldolase n=2 Tax=Marchantia polymorpha TaxID=3197 RepID=A0A176WRQ1_MARPO|nr:hypothetical protein AXG93_593s1230 [Marchantia polymorpha subsp. ruderalis]PTQ33111.1 hypothetical protein MARPO_0092s0072 [Marchantia polymorpha]BBN11489.1 hypothetical protein Mp_5g12340 [Marchantia polymorpha subsp. ruderalis]|eukprot:PTQ33111.1 hypothetical protein MARPO_0092s0072 [Marchantia polymorpha]
MATTLRHGCSAALNTSAVRSSQAQHVETRRVCFFGDNTKLKQGSLAKLASVFVPCGDRSATLGALRVRCMVLETKSSVEKKTALHDLYEKEGQSPWYDNLSRPVSDLRSLIDSGVRGVTSNPTIFEKAITSSDLYDDQFRQLMNEGNGVEEVFWGLAVTDIQDACDLFLPLYEASKGGDGFVSLEVSPGLADDGHGTVVAADRLYKLVNRPNLYIKIPATAECVPAVRTVISQEISVNVTLIFSLARYEAVINAYLEGLEAVKNEDLSKISSVASFFVSRVDVLVDKRLEKIGSEEALGLRGKAANAQAALAFKLYQDKFSGPRWEALAKRGANKQRLLWASTGVKNPAYPDTLYIAPLVGPDTVNTMPLNALEAFVDHGVVSRTIDANLPEAQKIYDTVEALGIRWADVGSQLEAEGVASFQTSFNNLISSLQAKADKL